MWLIYFWIAAPVTVVSAIGRIYLYFRRDIVTAYDLAESFISLAAIVGLYGYVYSAAILAPLLWRVILALIVCSWLWNFFAPKNRAMVKEMGTIKGAAVISIIQLLALPAIIGLYLYSFRSSALWH